VIAKRDKANQKQLHDYASLMPGVTMVLMQSEEKAPVGKPTAGKPTEVSLYPLG